MIKNEAGGVAPPLEDEGLPMARQLHGPVACGDPAILTRGVLDCFNHAFSIGSDHRARVAAYGTTFTSDQMNSSGFAGAF